jgi:hypothetical protein
VVFLVDFRPSPLLKGEGKTNRPAHLGQFLPLVFPPPLIDGLNIT